MGAAYLLVYLFMYGLPVVLMLGMFFLLLFLFRGTRLRWPVALGVPLVLSLLPWALDLLEYRRDMAKFAPDEIVPSALDLPPGRLLLIHPGNHAGLSCGRPCTDLTQASFVTEVGTENGLFPLTGGSGSNWSLGRHDLWLGFENPDRSQPFPYKYAFISVAAWRYPGATADTDYKLTHWPETAKGVHMLVEIPEDGILDFSTNRPLYRRFNLQMTFAEPFFMGFARETNPRPYPRTFVEELIALSQ